MATGFSFLFCLIYSGYGCPQLYKHQVSLAHVLVIETSRERSAAVSSELDRSSDFRRFDETRGENNSISVYRR